MKRVLVFAAVAMSALGLVNCESPPQEIHHHYHNTTRYTPPSKPYTGPSYKPASTGNTPETFQAVTPPSSYSR
jgi:hypothetical protein